MADVAEAKRLLDEATKECKSARTIADKHSTYADMKKRAVAALDGLNKLPADQKSFIAKDLEQLKLQLEQATAKAEKEKNSDEAITLLKKAQTELDQARVKAAMQSTMKAPAPNVKYLKVLMNESGGTKVLDDMVAQMDDKTSRRALEAAIEARFNVELHQYLSEDGIEINGNKYHGTADRKAPDKSVKRIYELLLKVPESHVRDNPKVQQIRRFQEDTGGAAYGGSVIYLNCGRAGATTSSDQGAELCSPLFFPDGVDEDCQPPADAKKKDVRYFDWATLHEVGHAVDDKHGFMAKNQSKDEFGGWVVYGADVTEPAKAAQKRFKYDLDYIKEKLNGNNPPAAPKPADREKKEWENAKAQVDQWCATVRSLRLWWNGEASKQVAIDGRVYQMSYDTPEWVSYKLEARKRGIHGYQFRAPGEWFAELYAAYYMGMLKPTHPAVKDWLPSKLT